MIHNAPPLSCIKPKIESDINTLSSFDLIFGLDQIRIFIVLKKPAALARAVSQNENLAINANDWDYVVRNVKNNPDKINLIKTIPDSNNYLLIGANRKNGFYIVTHFEVERDTANSLKNLLNKGDSLDRFGRTPASISEGSLHVNPSSDGRSSLGRFSGVESTPTLPQNQSSVKTKPSLNLGEKVKVTPAESGVGKPIVAEKPSLNIGEGKTPSKVGESIEAKAVEKGLTEGFGETAGYDKITIKDQAERSAKVMSDWENAKKMVTAKIPMEKGLRPEALIKAMEDEALKRGDVKTLELIARSPLVSETSAHAQAMRLLAERNPNSPVFVIKSLEDDMVRSAGGSSDLAKAQKKLNAKVDKQYEEYLMSAPRDSTNTKADMKRWIQKDRLMKQSTKEKIYRQIAELPDTINPADKPNIVKDLIKLKLGAIVTNEESAMITKFAKELNDTAGPGNLDYAKSRVKLENYVNDIRPELGGFGGKVSQFFSIQRAVQTGFDLSSALRQGAPYFGRKEWFGAVKRAFSYIKSPEAMDQLRINMYSHKDWAIVEPLKQKLGLTVMGQNFSSREEQFASRLIGKIPGLGASERFYEGMLNDLRFHRFVNTINARPDLKLNPAAMESLAKVISSSTGRGDLGRYGLQSAANSLSTALFAPKFMFSKIDMVLDPLARKGARLEAAKNLATTAGLFVALATGLSLAGVKVELDPRSSDFGKAKFGNTRVDLTFGFGQYVRLFAQLTTGQTKSTVTGKISKLNSGLFGSRTRTDVIADFLKGKQSPMFGLITDFMNQKDFGGNKLGFSGQAGTNSLLRLASMWEPMLVSDTMEAYKDASGQSDQLLPKDWLNPEGLKKGTTTFGLSLIGIGVNTYGGTSISIKQSFDKNPFSTKATKEFDRLQSGGSKPSLTNPSQNTAWLDLKEQKGEAKYNQALENFQKSWADAVERRINQPAYFKENDAQKKADLDKIKGYAEDKALEKAGYRAPDKKKVDTLNNIRLKNLVR